MRRWLAKRPALLWFCGGALFMATLGAPLAGAVGALFWTKQANLSDSWADDTLAARKVVAGVHEGWGLPDFLAANSPMPKFWDRPATGDTRYCESEFFHDYIGKKGLSARILERTYAAIIHEEQRSGKWDADWIAVEKFRHLPNLALGALAQCMEHSLLAGACTAWARRDLADDTGLAAKVNTVLLANAKLGDDQACFLLRRLLDAGKAASGGQTSIGTPK